MFFFSLFAQKLKIFQNLSLSLSLSLLLESVCLCVSALDFIYRPTLANVYIKSRADERDRLEKERKRKREREREREILENNFLVISPFSVLQ
jgi:hypothetical protein